MTLPLIAEFNRGLHDLVVVKQDPTGSDIRPAALGAQALWQETLVWVSKSAQPYDDRRPVPLMLSPAPCVYRKRAL